MCSPIKFAQCCLSLPILCLFVLAALAQGDPIPASSMVSSQKLGSVLVYNFYTSNASDPSLEETDFSLTNTNPTDGVTVHLFFVNAATNQATDTFVELAPRQTQSFLASNMDPGNAGFVVAVAVHATSGCPISFNYLSGDAYLKLATGHTASLPAVAFAALYSGGLGSCDLSSTTASLDFNGISYNEAPRALAVDNVLSPGDSNSMRLIVNRLGGSLAFGANAAPLGSNFGLLYDGGTSLYSFAFTGSNAQFRSPLSNTFPRIQGNFSNAVPAGTSGWMKFWPQSDAGVLGAILNFNPNAGTNQMAFTGGHNLRQLTLSLAGTLTIPVYPPTLKADLALSLAHSGSFTVGSTGDYTLTVNNAVMAKPATGTIKITDTLPGNLTLQSFSGAGWNCTGTGIANVSCTNGSGLAAGASLPTLTLTVNVGAGTPGAITNTATVSVAPQQESNTTNNSASDTLTFCTMNPVVANNNDSGSGSLREAIALACDGSTITFAGSVVSPITLTTGELGIFKNLTIQGPGANLLTISGNNASRVFATGAASITISGVTISGGNGVGTNPTGQGGGICNLSGTLNLINSMVSGNNSPNLNGGGIFNNAGTVNLTNSTVSGNTAAQFGGGIWNSDVATTTITNSTISGNIAVRDGAGIFNFDGTVTLINSTIAGNMVSGLTGGGIYAGNGSVMSQSSIIAKNTAPGGGPDVIGKLNSLGFNLIGNNSGANIQSPQPTDQIGTAANPIDPLLGPLAFNGGPTQTMALLPGSPAVDKGSAAIGVTTDQRGQPRLVDFSFIPNATGGNGADIGAFEVQTLPNTAPIINGYNITRQQGSAGFVETIAVVSDDYTPAGSMQVIPLTSIAGITITNIVNTNGTITANVAAGCSAPLGYNTILLQVTDGGGLTRTSNLGITVTANTPPTLSTYPNTSVAAGGNITVTPVAAPSDNGTLSITASAPGFTGSFIVNPTTGIVTINNLGPTGYYIVTVTATDNCGLTVSKTFKLFVNCPGATITVTTTADTVAADGACSLREAIQAANTNTAVNECPAGKPGLDTIYFAIGTGTPTINVTGSALPTITEPVVIDGAACQSTRVQLNGAGAGASANGLAITVGNSTIRNLVINRFLTGIRIDTGGSNVTENCFIGTDVTGTLDRGNAQDGILIASSSNNRIGGTSPSQRNLISGNDGIGIEIVGSSVNNVIQGNYIGTNVSGTQALGNVRDGIYLSSPNAGPNMIGGTVAGAGNLISGNGIQPGSGGAGISISGSGNQVLGNLIGTDITGSLPLGNLDGLRIFNNQNVIGGTAQGAANIIAYSSQSGVRVGNGTGNSILSNSIFSNALLGIDLFPLGITANDAGDADTGANNLQNFPVLTQATTGQIQGTLNSTANMTFTIQFFSNTACNPSGHGEGQSFIGQTTVTTNASGNGTISFTPAVPLALFAFITATATDPNGNTSEFSVCRLVRPPSLSINDVIVTEGNTGTVNAVFTVSLSGASTQTITMQFNTMGVTATSSSDYTATSGTLTFPPNTLTQAITVQVKGDTTIEPHETFFVNLSNLTNATITDNLGQGTILNDDCAPITLSPASLPDGLTNTSYNQFITASPGGYYNYAVTSGALPTGLLLDPLSGVFSGAPTTSGFYTFTIRATDVANGCIGTKTYMLTVSCPPATFIKKLGTAQLNSPARVAVDQGGNVYVTDETKNRVLKFDSNGNLLLIWGTSGPPDGQLNEPFGIAVDAAGKVIVSEFNNYSPRIKKFDSNGTFLSKWSLPNSNYSGIAVDTAGNVYVADGLGARILKYNANGIFLMQFGGIAGTGNGYFQWPGGVAVDTAGNVFVADTHNNRIQKFDAYGNFKFKWGSGQLNGPKDIAVDASGNVFVADSYNTLIQKFDGNGNFLFKWGNGQLAYPGGLAVSATSDIYVVDASQLLKFSLLPSPIANAGPDQTLTTTPGLPVPVTLNGTTSTNPGGGPLTYQWREGTTVLGTGATLNVNLTVGTHTITLYATNQCLIPATDTVVIKVSLGTPAGG